MLNKSLIVLIITCIEISGIGGKKHASETPVLWQRPVVTVLAYNGNVNSLISLKVLLPQPMI